MRAGWYEGYLIKSAIDPEMTKIILKGLLLAAGAGSATGAAVGGLTSAKGHGWEGAGRGALAGAGGGLLLGPLGGGVAGYLARKEAPEASAVPAAAPAVTA